MKRGLMIGFLSLPCLVAYAQVTTKPADLRTSEIFHHSPRQTALSQKEFPLAQVQRIQKKIARLERELADEKDRLVAIRRYWQDDPANQQTPILSKVASVIIFHSSVVGVDRGSKDGFRRSDKLIFVRQINGDTVITGISETISDLVPDKLLAVKTLESTSRLIQIGDQAYIINREDSPYSLIHARFRNFD